jgi:hypothetical protein
MPDEETHCAHCNVRLWTVEFNEPYTVEESRLYPSGNLVKPVLCEPCWAKAYKERFGEEPLKVGYNPTHQEED